MTPGTPPDAAERRFPVLYSRGERDALSGAPTTVPWSLLAGHEEQASRNHDQSLERLAERGGLDPVEMLAVIENRKWKPMTLHAAVEQLKEAVRAHETKQRAHLASCIHGDCWCKPGSDGT